MSRSVMVDGLAAILTKWQLSDPEILSQTPIAWLWKVHQRDGTTAVLKLYRQFDRGNEAAGADLLNAWSDSGAVQIFNNSGAAVLMQWLDGPSLGDIARSGEAKRADQLLCDSTRRLHLVPTSAISNLRPLEDVFTALFQLQITPKYPVILRHNIHRAAQIARHLLGSQPSPIPLHGDLHHDNVILTSAGPRVYDAKGYLGDPAFELANALRHPICLPALVRDPIRIKQVTEQFAKAMNVSPHRLAQWAAAKCALSIAWRAQGITSQDDESDLLALLLDQADQ
ncbi:hypothetical protein A9Q94_15955 [Rhodobacterales bacterium 56_14_T64]|nr:hypothetical protein A9Q94_15955 [Rhodobacterales bacterium 56_14_T64]